MCSIGPRKGINSNMEDFACSRVFMSESVRVWEIGGGPTIYKRCEQEMLIAFVWKRWEDDIVVKGSQINDHKIWDFCKETRKTQQNKKDKDLRDELSDISKTLKGEKNFVQTRDPVNNNELGMLAEADEDSPDKDNSRDDKNITRTCGVHMSLCRPIIHCTSSICTDVTPNPVLEAVCRKEINSVSGQPDTSLESSFEGNTENLVYTHSISKKDEPQTLNHCQRSRKTRKRKESPVKCQNDPSTCNVGEKFHVNDASFTSPLRRLRDMIRGCRTYWCYLLILCLLLRPQLSHSFSYPPDIECPKNLVAHGRLCCSYVRCDPGYQVKTCSTNFTADTCEVCPPGTMSYDPTDSNFMYRCDNIRDECPIDTIPVSFLATDKDPQACSKRCQCNITANYCGTDPCKCRTNHCEKHYQLQQDCGCSPTRGETRSVDVTLIKVDLKTDNTKSSTSRDENRANQTMFSTSIPLTSTSRKTEFSQTKTRLKTQTARTQQPPVTYDKQDNDLLVIIVVVSLALVIIASILVLFICRNRHRKEKKNQLTVIKNEFSGDINITADCALVGNRNTQNINNTALLSREQDATTEI